MSSSPRNIGRVALTAALATSLAFAGLAAKGGDGGGPANKVSASGASFDVFGRTDGDGMALPTTDGEDTHTVELLRADVKLSTPEDLILSVALECSISTELMTVGNSSANASGTLEVWIAIDGEPVPVSSDDMVNPGEVTFCNRAYGRTTDFQDDEDHAIDSYIRTKQSHSFNWLALDEIWADAADDNIHTIQVFGRLKQMADGSSTEEGQGDASALVTVGKRTLIIEPTKVANGEVVDMG